MDPIGRRLAHNQDREAQEGTVINTTAMNRMFRGNEQIEVFSWETRILEWMQSARNWITQLFNSICGCEKNESLTLEKSSSPQKKWTREEKNQETPEASPKKLDSQEITKTPLSSPTKPAEEKLATPPASPIKPIYISADKLDPRVYFRRDFTIGEKVAVLCEDGQYELKTLVDLLNQAVFKEGSDYKESPYNQIRKIDERPPTDISHNILLGAFIDEQNLNSNLYSSDEYEVGEIIAARNKENQYEIVRVKSINNLSIDCGTESFPFYKLRKISRNHRISHRKLGDAIDEAYINVRNRNFKSLQKNELLAQYDSKQKKYVLVQFVKFDLNNNIIVKDQNPPGIKPKNTLFKIKTASQVELIPGDEIDESEINFSEKIIDKLKPNDLRGLAYYEHGFRKYKLVKIVEDGQDHNIVNDGDVNNFHCYKCELYNLKSSAEISYYKPTEEMIGSTISLNSIRLDNVLNIADFKEDEIVVFIDQNPFSYKMGKIIKIDENKIEIDTGKSSKNFAVHNLFKIKTHKPISFTPKPPEIRTYKLGEIVDPEDMDPNGYPHVAGHLAVYGNRIVKVKYVASLFIAVESERGEEHVNSFIKLKALKPKFNPSTKQEPFDPNINCGDIVVRNNIRYKVLCPHYIGPQHLLAAENGDRIITSEVKKTPDYY